MEHNTMEYNTMNDEWIKNIQLLQYSIVNHIYTVLQIQYLIINSVITKNNEDMILENITTSALSEKAGSGIILPCH